MVRAVQVLGQAEGNTNSGTGIVRRETVTQGFWQGIGLTLGVLAAGAIVAIGAAVVNVATKRRR